MVQQLGSTIRSWAVIPPGPTRRLGMKSVFAAAASSAVLVAAGSASYARSTPQPQVPLAVAGSAFPHAPAPSRRTTVPNEALTAVVRGTCGTCHSERQKAGNLVLANFDVATATSNAET